MKKTYTQCVLVKDNRTQLTWIPSKFAKLGEILKLKEHNVWEDGWIVQFVGSEGPMPNSRQLIRGHRKMTGDSLPKNL
jgi:hypothetical protein